MILRVGFVAQCFLLSLVPSSTKADGENSTVKPTFYFSSWERTARAYWPLDEFNGTSEIVTPHEFNYTAINPYICSNASHPIISLIVIHSGPDNQDRRMAIRRTWLTYDLYRTKATAAIFVMGHGANETVQKRIQFEQSQYGDIFQEDFKDSYRNMTFKSQMWMKFAKLYCSKAKYVVKSDDDMFLNIFAILNYIDELETVGNHGKKLWCYVWRRPVSFFTSLTNVLI